MALCWSLRLESAWEMYYRKSIIKVQLKLTNLIFWTKFTQKGYFGSKTGKEIISIEFCIFKLVLVPDFSMNWQLWVFRLNLVRKSVSDQKQEKGNITIEFCIFQLVLIPNFSLNNNFDFLGYFGTFFKSQWKFW